MPETCQKGAILPILMLLLLVGGVGLGTYLIQQKTNLLPKASGYYLRGAVFYDCNKNAIKDENEKVASNAKVEYSVFTPFYQREGVKFTDNKGEYGFTASDKTFYLAVSNNDFRWRQSLFTKGPITMDVTEKVMDVALVPIFSDLKCDQNGEIYNLPGIKPPENWLPYQGQDLEGLVWWDFNKNSVRDRGEINLPGIKVNLLDKTGTRILNVSYTNENDGWDALNFGIKTNPFADTYIFQVEVPEGYVKTTNDRVERTCREWENPYPWDLPRTLSSCDPDKIEFGIAPANGYIPSSTEILLGDIELNRLNPLSCNGKYPQVEINFKSNISSSEYKHEIWRKIIDVTDWQLAKEVYTSTGGKYIDDRIDSNTYGKTAVYLVRAEGDFGRKDSQSEEIVIPNCGSPTVTPTPTPTPTPSSTPTPQPSASATGTGTLTIKGTVYRDFNGNGVLDNGDKEYADSPVYLHNPDGSQVLAQFRTTGGGNFAFYNLTPGIYRVTHYVPPGYSKTTDDSFSFDLNSDKTVYFGIKPNI